MVALSVEREVINELRERLKRYMGTTAGMKCPVCRRLVKQYKNTILKDQALTLAWIYKRGTRYRKWVEVQELAGSRILRDNTHGKLVWWGLIESKANIDPKKKNSGIWRLTLLGVEFVEGRASVPKYKWTYNKKVIRTSRDETISINDPLPYFDFRKLMSGQWQIPLEDD